ncbi:MAG: Dabb family protein [Planctomycetaceae bacterium]
MATQIPITARTIQSFFTPLVACVMSFIVTSLLSTVVFADEKPATTVEKDNVPDVNDSGKVLRHTVFFAFKNESSDADIQKVVDAFRALPSKIDSIVDFEWGINNSPEKLNDGFTHCFVVTFRHEGGRDLYLPHPAHKDFVEVLKPHMEKVFVIDYWGDQRQKKLDKPLRHAVFFRFKKDAPERAIIAVEDAFLALPDKIDAIKGFEWGTNHSTENHDDGFTHCFMVTFADEAGRAAYLPHPAHKEFVRLLPPILEAPRVLDFYATK